MRKILITVNDGSIARNILHSFVLKNLLDDVNVAIGLVVPAEKSAFYVKEFGSPRVEVFSYRRGPPTLWEKMLSFLSRNGIATRTTFTDQRTQYLGDHRYLWFFLKRSFTTVFGRRLIYHRLVRVLARLRKPSAEVHGIFSRAKPSLLFSTDVQSELDLNVQAAARKFQIPIVGMVRSWDNLSSRSGLIQIVPDLLLVWNKYLYGHAKTIQHLPMSRVKVVGAPQYDWFVKKEVMMARDAFLARFKINPAKKVILFAGIGNFLAPHEPEVVEMLADAMEQGKVAGDTAMIFRPHPHFLTERDRIAKLPHVVFDDGIADYTGKERSSWEMDQEKFAHLINSLYHADVVVTTASTITMDAVIFDKPVVCIAFDGRSKESYWNSVLRYYRDYTHYRSISETGGFKVAYSIEELVYYLNGYLRDPAQDAAGRQKIRDEFVGVLDGQRGACVAAELLSCMKGTP